MAHTVTLPELGESVTEGTVTRWLKAVGDSVAEGEALLEVSTDKVDTEVPSPVSGVVEQILIPEDGTATVGAELAIVGDGSGVAAVSDEAAPVSAAATAAPTPAAETPAPPAPAGTEVVLPELGEGVSEGVVSRWLKAVGDSVAEGEALLEVSTDKVDTEVPSPVAGTLQAIVVEQDANAAVGQVIAVIGDGAAVTPAPAALEASPAPETPAAPAAPPAPAAPTAPPAPAPAAPPTPAAPKSYITPLVRKIAADNNVDLSTVTGTGVGGRIRKEDVLAAVATPAVEPGASAPTAPPAPQATAAPVAAVATPAVEPGAPAPTVETPAPGAPPAPAAPPAPPAVEPGAPAPTVETPAPAAPPAPTAPPAPPAPAAPTSAASVRGTTEKMTRLRAIVAERMVEALQTQAQLTTVVKVDVTAVAALRAKAKESFKAREGANLTFLPFYAKAAAEALKQFPKINASIDTEAGTITYYDSENIGIAVDTPKGLMVPVVKGAGDMSLAGLAKSISDLGARARIGKVTADELQGATFTITNTGSGGALFDTPIVPVGQVAILGTGTLVKEPAVITGADGSDVIAIRQFAHLFLSYDHRLVDGADAARFLSAVKARIEAADFAGELGI